MGSFAGTKIDLQNFEQTVNLAQKKALLNAEEKYRENLKNSTFPDGQYYVTSDFNSKLVRFQGDVYNPNLLTEDATVVRQFKKGELVNVITFTKDMAMNTVKVIQTDSGNFYADQNNLSKTKPVEPVTTNSLVETKKANGDKTKIIIIGAFVLGFLLSKE